MCFAGYWSNFKNNISGLNPDISFSPIMKKYFVPVLFLGAFFLCPAFARADVAINEIMYDLDGGDIDWVEVQNTGSDIDLTTLKLFISNSTSNHAIVKSTGSSVLHSGDYGVIVGSSVLSNYTAKWGSTGNIFTSSFTLTNEGGTVQINNGDKLSPLDSVSYTSSQGAAGDGKSLQNSGSSWISATPTPNDANGESDTNTNTDTTDTSTTDTATTQVVEGKTVTVYKISSKIISKTKVVVGIPNSFSALTTGTAHETLYKGRWSWNFGDGTAREYVEDIGTFTHTFSYPGDYVVTLEYSDNFFGLPGPSATDRVVISAVTPKVLISNIFYDDKGGIEISNASGIDMDLAGWIIGSGQTNVTFPKNTILLSGKKIMLPGKVLGLDIRQGQTVSLFYPDSTIASIFPKQAETIKTAYVPRIQKESPMIIDVPLILPTASVATATVVTPNLLQANAVTALPVSAPKNNTLLFGSFASMTIAGALIAVHIRRKKAKAEMSLADEFTIME